MSMGGPHVNWSVKISMDKARAEKELLPLIDVGSCRLNVIHSAFETRMKAAGWELERVMSEFLYSVK